MPRQYRAGRNGTINFNFNDYYAAILRRGGRVQPRADEALRDYQTVVNTIVAAGTLG